MAWSSSRRELWAHLPKKLRVMGILSVVSAVLVLSLGFYFTTGSRQTHFAAASHYERSKAVSDSVATYTRSCDVLAASRNIRALAGLTGANSFSASSLANQAMQDVVNINSTLPDDSSVAVYFPTLELSVTKRQFRFSASFSRILASAYPGLPEEQLLSQDDAAWHSYYADGFCYIIRSVSTRSQTAAYILAKFPVEAVFPGGGRSIGIIGDSDTCLYASRADLPEDLYSRLLQALGKDRKVTVGATQYYAIRNEFSGLTLRFFTLVPMLTGAALVVRILCVCVSLALLAIPVLLLKGFERKQKADEALMPKTCEKDSHYVISGLARSLLDVQKDRDQIFSRQFYEHLHFAPNQDSLLLGFALLEDQQKLFDNSQKPGEHRPITPYFILNNMLQDLLYDRHTGCLCFCSNKYIAICDLLPGETEANIQAILEQVVRSAKEYLCIAFVSVSPVPCHGVAQLHGAITKVSQQLDYERLWWRTEKVPAASATELNPIDFYNRIGLLNSCILENNYVKAEEVFKAILRDHIPTGVDQVRDAESRLQLLLGTLVSLTGYPRDRLPSNALPPKTVAACQDAGEQIFRAQLAAQSSASANPSKDRIRAISEYVTQHYMDSDLSVGTIAARFGMNAAYLSRAFKDSTGTNLLEYIHKTRIAAAKTLLQDHPVKEVYQMVGFADGQSFVRIFRKYESVTPAEYKRNCTAARGSE